MAIIKQHDKRSGITYVYESKSYWDPEKKMSRAKRKLIGRLDPKQGRSFLQMGGIVRRSLNQLRQRKSQRTTKSFTKSSRKKCEAQEVMIKSLKKQIEELKG